MKNGLNRREFLSTAAIAGAVGTLGASSLLTSCTGGGTASEVLTPLIPADQVYNPNLTDKAVDGKPLKAVLVGCGGRGSGAIRDFLAAANNVTCVALADVFEDRVKNVQKMLKENYQIDIPDANCFVGFDAYKKALAVECDLMVTATPPAFRPMHYKAAVDAGKHAFLEKPIGVDPVGLRTIMTAAKKAESQGLCCVTGTQRRHQRPYVESYKQIMSGLMGEITGGAVYWNQGMLWYRNRDEKWTDMEWMIRDWVNWTWLSGDHVVEQHVHNIDVFSWMVNKKPVSALAFGARHRRITGNQYDMFSADVVYEGNVHLHSMCRQIDGCANNVSEFIQGSKGSWWSGDMAIRNLKGEVIWQYDSELDKQFQQNNAYVLEHVDLITHIREGKLINQVEGTAISTLTAVMIRESAYTGKQVKYDDIFNSQMDLLPKEEELVLGPMDMAKYGTLAVPGKGKEA